MSYQGPLLIREPELRWPIVILAAIITIIIALVVAGLHYLAMTQPANRFSGPRLTSELREGESDLEQSREQNEIAGLIRADQARLVDGPAVDLSANVRTNIGGTISELEVSDAAVDA